MKSANKQHGQPMLWVFRLSVAQAVMACALYLGGYDLAHATAMLTYTFDDGASSQWDAYQILQERGQVGTIGAVARYVATGYPTVLSKAQLLTMQSAGWETASHGLNHRALSKMPLTYADEPLSGWQQESAVLFRAVQGFIRIRRASSAPG